MSEPTSIPSSSAMAEPAKAWIEKVSEEIEQVPMSFWKLIAIYFFGMAFLGFVIKRYIAYILFAVALSGGVLWVLHYIGAAQFDFTALRTYFNISQDASVAAALGDIFSWSKSNVALVVAAIVGFVVGLQLG